MGLRRGTPGTAQRAAFEKDHGAHALAVRDGGMFDPEDGGLFHASYSPFLYTSRYFFAFWIKYLLMALIFLFVDPFSPVKGGYFYCFSQKYPPVFSVFANPASS